MSQKELAESLGVGQTAIANYEKGIRSPSLDQIAKLSLIFNVSIDRLIGPFEEEKEKIDEKVIMNYLKESDDVGLYKLFESIELSDSKLVKMLEGPIRNVLYTVGSMWEQGNLSIAKEHQYSNIMSNVVTIISKKRRRPVSNKEFRALSISYSDDLHTIGSKYIEEYLSILGIKSILIGNNTPLSSVSAIIKEEDINLITISLTMENYLSDLYDFVKEIKARHPKLKVIVGGQAFACRNQETDVGADGCANDFNTLIAVINKLMKEGK
jgi:methanogenic corrinoid protein MtbC1